MRTIAVLLASAALLGCSTGGAPPPEAPPVTVHPDSAYQVEALTEKPELANRRETARALEELYPATLRDRGLGGVVVLDLVLDAAGRVEEARVEKSSGYVDLDRAGRDAALRMRFTPGRIGDTPVRARMTLPLTFQTRG